MPTLRQIRDKVDAKLVLLWQEIVAFQTAYFAAKGRYWQGLYSHRDAPVNTRLLESDVSADDLDNKPSDQDESWRDVGRGILDMLEDVPIPFRLRVDVYEAPSGHGFAATVQVRFNGAVYERSQGYGPEAAIYTADWHVWEPDEEVA